MPLTVGSRLGHYDVTALIGEGGALLRQPRSTVRGSADSVAEWTVAAAADPDSVGGGSSRLGSGSGSRLGSGSGSRLGSSGGS